MSEEVRASIIEHPDGSFEVPARSAYVRDGRITAFIFTLGALVIGVAFVFFSVNNGFELSPIIFGPLALNIALSGLVWSSAKAPLLRADPTTVTLDHPFRRRQVRRSELTAVFRGHSWLGTYRGTRLRFYAFVGTDGRYRFEVPARWFDAENVAEFANRLNLPMRGDFTQSIIRTSLM